jgi:DNA polymerase/3'-5' exonuclease PolX
MLATKPKTKYQAFEARAVAEHLKELLSPLCSRIEIAGSLRRGKSLVGDIELLFVPRGTKECHVAGSLFLKEERSVVDVRLEELLGEGVLQKRLKINHTETWGPSNKFAVHIESGIPVDFFCTSEECWWNALVCRTGSADTNLLLAQSAQRQGCSFVSCGAGVRDPAGNVHQTHSEEEVFRLCGVRYREPRFR